MQYILAVVPALMVAVQAVPQLAARANTTLAAPACTETAGSGCDTWVTETVTAVSIVRRVEKLSCHTEPNC